MNHLICNALQPGDYFEFEAFKNAQLDDLLLSFQEIKKGKELRIIDYSEQIVVI